MTSTRKRSRRYLPVVLVAVFVAGLGGGAIAFVRQFLNTPAKPQKQVVQEIHLIRPPPPPPDVPPPPPPPEEKVDVPDPQKPDPTPSKEPPPGQQLGLDAEGTAGGDAFGLLGNKGGRDLIGTGGGSVFAWYAGIVKGEVLARLSEDDDLRRGAFEATIQLRFSPDGTVHAQIVKSSGDRKRDREIEGQLNGFKISKEPPAEIPSVMSLSVVGHG